MDWFLLSIISLIAASTLGILRKVLMANTEKTLDNVILFQFFGAFFIFIILIFNDFSIPNILEYPLNYLINSVFWGGSMILLFKAYKYIEASEIAVLTTIELLLAILLGRIFLNEKMTLLMFIGIFLILVSVLIISIKKINNLKFNKGFIYVLCSALLAGIAVTNDVYLLRNTDTLGFVFIAFLFPGLFVYLIKIIQSRTTTFNLKQINLKVLTLLALAAVISNVPFYFAFLYEGQISQVLTIHKTSIIFTILLAAIFLNEKKYFSRKIISGILAVIGIILIGI